jgi:HEAT repeat protein
MNQPFFASGNRRDWSVSVGLAVIVATVSGCTDLVSDKPAKTVKVAREKVDTAPQPILKPKVVVEEPKPDLEPLIEALADVQSDEEERIREGTASLAKLAVDELRRVEVNELLVPLLEAENKFIRRNVILALRVWANGSTVPALVAKLSLKMPSQRKVVIDLLGYLKPKQAIVPLAERLANAFDRAHIIKALIEIGPPVEEEMLEQIESESAEVRLAVCQVLHQVGTDECIDTLLEAVEDQDTRVAVAAMRAVTAVESR